MNKPAGWGPNKTHNNQVAARFAETVLGCISSSIGADNSVG